MKNSEALRSEEAFATSPRLALLFTVGRISSSRALVHRADDCFGNVAAYIVLAVK